LISFTVDSAGKAWLILALEHATHDRHSACVVDAGIRENPVTRQNGGTPGFSSSEYPPSRNMNKNIEPYVLRPGESFPGSADGVKASGHSTSGGFTMIESQAASGAPWHVHTREDEYFYVVDGEIMVWCGKQEFRAGPRSFVFLPRGIPHAWDVTSRSKAIVLMMTVPAMLD
jgi:quercetin dioxygenase-like cupin family protein